MSNYNSFNQTFNLRASVVRNYWQRRNKALYEFFKIVESVEYWRLDTDADVATNISNLSFILASGYDNTEDLLKREDVLSALILILAYISYSVVMRFATFLSDNYPEVFGELMKYAIKNRLNDSYSNLFIQRFIVLINIECVREIYSEERINEIKEIVKDVVS